MEWAVTALIATVPALGASVLYFALLGEDRDTAAHAGSAPAPASPII